MNNNLIAGTSPGNPLNGAEITSGYQFTSTPMPGKSNAYYIFYPNLPLSNLQYSIITDNTTN
jgi:hypothetical protein